MHKPEYFLGLDLGQTTDPSALIGLEKVWRPKDSAIPNGEQESHYTLRGCKRWPLGTKYTAIVADVISAVAKEPLAGCTLGIDGTGVGRPVVDLFTDAKPDATLQPVLITSGHKVNRDGGYWHIPKRELVAAIQCVLQSGRLAIPKNLGESSTLVEELKNFRAKITTNNNEQFEGDWRAGQHDDLVLALAIAIWLGERQKPPMKTKRNPVFIHQHGMTTMKRKLLEQLGAKHGR